MCKHIQNHKTFLVELNILCRKQKLKVEIQKTFCNTRRKQSRQEKQSTKHQPWQNRIKRNLK